MKLNENAAILGTLKLRSGIVDRVVTDGGFYSGQFGEVAYKSDFDSAGIFYGITVKHSDDSYPSRPVSVVSFADEFYLTQNSPNTDEVVVSIASKGVVVLNRERTILRRADVTDALRIQDVTIPAGALGTEGAARGWVFGQFQASSSRIFQIVVSLNGVTIFQDSTSGHTGDADVKPFHIEWILGQRQSSTLAFFQGTMFVGLGQDLGVGYGDLDSGLTHHPIFGNSAVADNSAVDQRLTIDMNMTTAVAGHDFYRHFAFAEIL